MDLKGFFCRQPPVNQACYYPADKDCVLRWNKMQPGLSKPPPPRPLALVIPSEPVRSQLGAPSSVIAVLMLDYWRFQFNYDSCNGNQNLPADLTNLKWKYVLCSRQHGEKGFYLILTRTCTGQISFVTILHLPARTRGDPALHGKRNEHGAGFFAFAMYITCGNYMNIILFCYFTIGFVVISLMAAYLLGIPALNMGMIIF